MDQNLDGRHVFVDVYHFLDFTMQWYYGETGWEQVNGMNRKSILEDFDW